MIFMKTPAENVIKKFGGHQGAATAAGVHLSRVYRWTYDIEHGGTGGKIPSRHYDKLLNEAAKLGIDLNHADFFTSAAPREVAA